MPESVDSFRASLAVLAGVVVLWTQLWRALLFVAPASVRVEPEEPGPWTDLPPPLAEVWRSLAALGFVALGTHSERPFLGRPRLYFDGVHLERRVFASVCVDAAGPRLTLLSRCERGVVVTRDHRAPALEAPGYRAGVLERVSPERLVRAHQRRADDLGAPVAPPTLEGRVELARWWYRGPGRAELRLQHAVGFLWAAGGLLVVIAGAVGLLDR